MSTKIAATAFGDDFFWGVGMAATQNEGAYNEGGKGLSIWDKFAMKKGNIKRRQTPFVSCDFYHYYKADLLLAKKLGFKCFRFSISWPRILPDGTGKVNKQGIDFYHELIDECLRLELIPFVTLYHWDLPYSLQKQGGWTNIAIVKWFANYVKICAEHFGKKVKNWIILNEPLSFTALGYMLGKHAPGMRGLKNFIPAIHHATMAQAEGGRVIRNFVDGAYIGTSFSCSEIIPFSFREEDIKAAQRIDILMNRLFIEPSLGLNYPYTKDFDFLRKLEFDNKTWRYIEKMRFDFDFIGLQNYFPVVVKHNRFVPVIQAIEVKPKARKVEHTDMGWEVNAYSFARIIKQIASYPGIKDVIITENGAAYKDMYKDAAVDDKKREAYFKQHLSSLLKIKNEGINVKGYFAWTLTDNFEWSEGYHPKFGLVHVDFKTQVRTIKRSGYFWRSFLNHDQ